MHEGRTIEMKWILYLFLIAIFGGAIRKWFVNSPALSNIILGVQMILPFMMNIFSGNNSKSPFAQFGILIVYFFYLAFHIIYPLQLTIFHGIFGLLIHGGFWIGIFYYFSNRRNFDMNKFLLLFMLVAVGEIILAFIQYGLPQTHFLNKYAREGQTIAVVGENVRVTGTFSYLSGFTAYLMFYMLIIGAMIRKRMPQWLVLLGLAAGIVACFMSGSRSIAVIYLVVLIPLLIKEYPIQSLFRVAGSLIIPALVLIAILTTVNKIPIVENVALAYENFISRVESNAKSGEQKTRIFGDLHTIQHRVFKHPFFGVGLGATYQGANILFGISKQVLEFGYVETEFTRMLLEGGWILVLLRTILSFIFAFQLSFKGFLRWAIWFVVAFGQPIIFNPHNSAFLLLGIILLDNIYWRQQNAELEESSKANSAKTFLRNTPPLVPMQ